MDHYPGKVYRYLTVWSIIECDYFHLLFHCGFSSLSLMQIHRLLISFRQASWLQFCVGGCFTLPESTRHVFQCGWWASNFSKSYKMLHSCKYLLQTTWCNEILRCSVFFAKLSNCLMAWPPHCSSNNTVESGTRSLFGEDKLWLIWLPCTQPVWY